MCVGATFLVGSVAGAAEHGKIGFFESQRLLAESKQLRVMQTELEAKRMAQEKEVEAVSPGLDDPERRQKRIQDFLGRHTDPSGQVRPELWEKGVEQILKMRSAPGTSPPAPEATKESGDAVHSDDREE